MSAYSTGVLQILWSGLYVGPDLFTGTQHQSSTCTEVSGVENIGQCGKLSQLSWLLGAL